MAFAPLRCSFPFPLRPSPSPFNLSTVFPRAYSSSSRAAVGRVEASFSRRTPRRSKLPCFAFDIDGTLVRGKRVLPEARRALSRMFCKQTNRQLYPFVLLTNGGGMMERQRAKELEESLGVPIRENHIVLAHSPMKDLVHLYRDQPILVSGSDCDRVESLMASYGFRKPISTLRYVAQHPLLDPFNQYAPCGDDGEAKFSGEKIGAVFVVNDPQRWETHLQVLVDVLSSNGDAETQVSSQVVPAYFSNPDMLWSAEFSRPRFGQGAFTQCLGSLYKEITGCELQFTQYGKPHEATYRYAEACFREQLGTMEENAQHEGPESARDEHSSDRIGLCYGIGDNPSSDVCGANNAGSHWVSIMTSGTGLFEPSKLHPPDVQLDDVEQAVEFALFQYQTY